MAEERGAMFDEFVKTGLLDDATVLFKGVRFRNWDYGGTKDKDGNAINELGLGLILVDEEGKEWNEVLSAGKLQFFVPSSDGRKALPVGKYQKLNISTNAAEFIMALMNADTRGQLAAKLKTTDDISILEGMKAHVVRKAQQKRETINVLPGADGQQKDRTMLMVDKIISYPWEAPGAAAPSNVVQMPTAQAAAPAAPAPQAAAPAAASPVADIAAGLLMAIVAGEGGAIKKLMVAGKVFQHPDGKALDVAVRNQVLGTIVKDDFLTSATVTNMGIKYNAATGDITLG